MKVSIKFICLIFMSGVFVLSCKKTADTTPDASIYDMDSTTTTVDSISPAADTTNINSSTTGTTGATGKGTTGSGSAGTTEKGNINNNSNIKKDSTTKR